MADQISLVKGDSVANVSVTLVREDTGAAFTLTQANVRLYIRKKGSTTLLSTITHDSGSSNFGSGVIVFALGTFLSSNTTTPGYYEGELEIEFNPDTSPTKQTVFEEISIFVRDQFA